MITLGAVYPRSLLPTVLQSVQALADREKRKIVVRSMGAALVYAHSAGVMHPGDGLIAVIEPCPKGHTRAWQIGPDGHPYSNALRV